MSEIPTPTTPVVKKKRQFKAFYVSKADMMAELIEYNKTQVISEKLGKMFLDIAQRYMSRTNFYRYSYKDDMIGDAVARMVSQVSKFNINHPSANPFSYFTQVAHCQVLQLLKKEKRQRDSKTNLRDKIWEEMCLDEGMEFVSEERGSDE